MAWQYKPTRRGGLNGFGLNNLRAESFGFEVVNIDPDHNRRMLIKLKRGAVRFHDQLLTSGDLPRRFANSLSRVLIDGGFKFQTVLLVYILTETHTKTR